MRDTERRISTTRRTNARYIASFRANLQQNGKTIPVTVINISCDGAMIQSESAGKKGELVSFSIPDVATFNATVAWNDGTKMGLIFSLKAHQKDIMMARIKKTHGELITLRDRRWDTKFSQ